MDTSIKEVSEVLWTTYYLYNPQPLMDSGKNRVAQPTRWFGLPRLDDNEQMLSNVIIVIWKGT